MLHNLLQSANKFLGILGFVKTDFAHRVNLARMSDTLHYKSMFQFSPGPVSHYNYSVYSAKKILLDKKQNKKKTCVIIYHYKYENKGAHVVEKPAS